ncbi:uncharacterized protein BJX67DRAFT_185804 [Aspergillus lucknowensis]|uniref:Luciferase domain-containing protein n=1 Tax=Aspergillus lucknowensis TaxID=176173 RepID=A0ABR4LLN5_9EURO
MASGYLLLSHPEQEDFPLALFSLFRAQLVLVLLLPLALYLINSVRKDYHAFLALGPGGTPSTPAGYIRICILRLVTLRDPFAPPSIPPTLSPKHGVLSRTTLPARSGPRPTTVGIAPQRQMTQKAEASMYEALTTEIRRLANTHPRALYMATSCFEKHNTGMFCRITDPTTSPSPTDTNPTLHPELQSHKHRITCNGEVCHSHPSDGSLHLTLHPADVRLVLERGWGERHPLARDDWWWVTRFVPPGFVMIYAPRGEDELECVLEIIRAAVWWVGGKELR